MMRRTSIEARKTIEENGLLSKLKLETYEALFDYGPCSAGELFLKAGWQHTKNNHNISSRLGELRDLGVVYEVTERPCNITGHEVIIWDVTEKLPNGKKLRSNGRRKQLEAENRIMREALKKIRESTTIACCECSSWDIAREAEDKVGDES